MAYFFQLPLITDLTEDQQMALDEVNPIAISGGAGTGKTVVSLWRHIQNMETLNKYSVLVTYTKTLGLYLSMSIRAIENQTKYQSENIQPPSSQVFILKTFPFTQNWKVYEIIIDEAQDLTFNKLEEMQSYGENISYGADFNQKLYPNTIKENEIKKLFPQNIEYNLQQNFRNSYHVLNFVKGILPELYIPQNTLDELKDENIGLKPIMFISDDFEKEIEKTIELINEFKSDTHNIAILLPFGKDTFSNGQQVKDSVDNYYKVLSSKNIDCSRYFNEMKTDDIEISNIHITTYKSVKGLEFDTVIIPFMNKFQDYKIKDKFPEVVNEEDYYVAFTRAKTNLYLISDKRLNFINETTVDIEEINSDDYDFSSEDEFDSYEDDFYNSLKIDDGEPVYLSDGVWLYPDGSTRSDR